MQEWFKSWFDSPYYHILYCKRDDQEAKRFIENLIAYLKPEKGARMLDQACGRGRHARILNSMGFDVTGIDLSENNISWCKQFENDTLRFSVHDMRRIYATNLFGYVLNLFTSIGYFRHDHDQQLTVDSAAAALHKNGFLIIDFMNARKVLAGLIAEETKSLDGIDFSIKRKIEDNFIVKEISFRHQNQFYCFHEYVEAMMIEDFERYFKNAGLKIQDIFGNYSLESFDAGTSERLILIAKKI